MAGDVPIIKLRNLEVGKTYRLLDPTVSTIGMPQDEEILGEYKKIFNNLHTRPHTLLSKERRDSNHIILTFAKLPNDEAVDPYLQEEDKYELIGYNFPQRHDTEFAQEPLRGGKGKTRKSQGGRSRKGKHTRKRRHGKKY
jgi:hypothetical protein